MNKENNSGKPLRRVVKNEGGHSDNPQELPKQAIHSPLPAISVPKGGGAIHGIGEQFSFNAVTGTASTSIPISTSRSRSNISPNLNLKYDSGAGNGVFGFGWGLSLPSITRKTEKGLPRYDDAKDSDIFISAEEGDLLPVLEREENGEWVTLDLETYESAKNEYQVRNYRPRVEEAFTRTERWTRICDGDTHWRTISRDNITTVFGSDKSSRIFDPENPSRVFSWLVSENYDDRGNRMKYEYKAENSDAIDISKPHENSRTNLSRSANKYPKRIKYGNRTSRLSKNFNLETELWMFEVVFDYGDHDEQRPKSSESQPWLTRSDAFSTYRPTFELRTYRLCQRILHFHHFPDEENIGNDCLVFSLDIQYQDTNKNCPASGNIGSSIASFITSVAQTSYVRSGAGYAHKSIPPVEFTYSAAEMADEVQDVDHKSLENLPVGLDNDTYEFVDLKGEGVSGIVGRQGDGFFYKPNLGNAQFGCVETLLLAPSMFRTPEKTQQWLDLASDGNVSLVEFDRSCPGFYKRNKDSPGGWERFKTFSSLPMGISWHDPNLKLIDLSGTGLADVLIVNEDIFTYYPSLAEHGFGVPSYWRPPLDEDAGPRVLFSNGVESVYFAVSLSIGQEGL